MRVIDAFDGPVRTVTVSPDGRFLAAASQSWIAVVSWVTGAEIVRVGCLVPIRQLAFTADGAWMVAIYGAGPLRWATVAQPQPIHIKDGAFSGGIAISPDGKTFVATRDGYQQRVTLEQWELPTWRPKSGFDFWSPFERLAFSPNGEYIAGISREVFELRYAESGGLNHREQPPRARRYLPARLHRGIPTEEPSESAYLTFPQHSETVVYGWDSEFHVMETRNGNVLKRVPARDDQLFLDAAFLGTGRQLATVDGSPEMRVWSADSWEVLRGFDWGSGGLTCVTATADGLAGVCGTDTGKLVVFDVDE